MRKTFLLTLLAGFCAQALPAPSIQEYAFRFQPFNGETYKYQTKASTQEEAYERAATACFTHYKKGRRINMEVGIDIIDICANPRTI
jgi:hypothetical protein